MQSFATARQNIASGDAIFWRGKSSPRQCSDRRLLGGVGLSVKPLHAPIRRQLVERGGRRREATIGFKPYRRLSSLIRSDLIDYRWTDGGSIVDRVSTILYFVRRYDKYILCRITLKFKEETVGSKIYLNPTRDDSNHE